MVSLYFMLYIIIYNVTMYVNTVIMLLLGTRIII